ncbi:putative response regulator transcription regulator protein [Burkholderia lata]|uniref:Putative response regulator transcription regulator protein n=1 Tax=Burkholderia lata (strain ATCC 17760 / DSM 23089 / LMG 22485 / NCIMB 9086 / R18194 / 383) TaxID=482957 RepID=A0A6P2TG10_BURL3|nr:response regulator transcription factor [Burkholderia lata]VWC56448.1 putative response regulator transcription regulator protein [Burkholderia lata]
MNLAVFSKDMTRRDAICSHLAANGIAVDRFDDETTFARALTRREFDAILISMESGIDQQHPVLVHRACHGVQRAPLILICSPRDSMDAVDLLDYETDEIVLAPVNLPELLLRLRLTSHRLQRTRSNVNRELLTCGPYRLDRHASTVSVAGDVIRLTSREFAIAWMLFSQLDKYVARGEIARAVWGSPEDIVSRSLEQHIYKLRKKLSLNGIHGTYLRTMYAVGYRIFIQPPSHGATPARRRAAMPLPAYADDGDVPIARHAASGR